MKSFQLFVQFRLNTILKMVNTNKILVVLLSQNYLEGDSDRPSQRYLPYLKRQIRNDIANLLYNLAHTVNRVAI
jgi:hypothetical protein